MLALEAKGKDRQILIPEATDLGNFGSREWMTSVLLSYSDHFAPIKNAAWYQEAMKAKADGKPVEFLNLDDSQMASAVNEEYSKVFSKPENAEDLKAVVEYLVAQRNRAAYDKIDEKLAARGQAILAGDKLTDGSELTQKCTDCHEKLGQKFELSNVGIGSPDLAGYGSADWLKAFLKNPGSEQFYGAKNRMPSYAGKLLENELDVLVRWMTGDYFATHVETYPSRANELPKP